MTTIEELVEFCNEEEPVGALLLTGEWGCGKTYLIEHEFKEKTTETAVVLRISLFGLMEIDEIHNAINNAWIDEYCKQKKLDTVLNYVSKGQKLLGKLDFLPESIKGLGTTNLSDCIPIKNTMDDKSVILVFDDLERCHINTVDVLGLINDYSENLKYHTIIIANQEKIIASQNPTKIIAEIQYNSNKSNSNTDNKNATIIIDKQGESVDSDISYTEIKEKIIQRTVQYQPNYNVIISNIIDNLKCGNEEYRTFITTNKDVILDLFAPDELLRTDNNHEEKRPHNIRSLRCAINDFYRVYTILKENEIDNIQHWLYSFIAYVISYKADIAKEGYYGTIFCDDQVQKLYPAFNDNYILSAVKKWILNGIWDNTAITHEIMILKKRAEVVKASDIIKYNRIMDIDEETIYEGFEDFLNDVYQGLLTLDEYVLFIENSCWARRYKFEFPIDIDWNEVGCGVDICIDEIKKELPEGQLLYRSIGDNNKDLFNEKEWSLYQKIDFFASQGLMYYRNKLLYLDAMNNHASKAFVLVQNKRFNLFDDEMAIATAFKTVSNADKNDYSIYFDRIWTKNIQTEVFEYADSKNSFIKLKNMMNDMMTEYIANKKIFAELHTKRFIEVLENIISITD
ncbi:MAG: hypothetical protein IJB74_08930 [Clostridia bacterium]|nr:hypothetical protein [Clostridia bacterium]